jgi:hypothetical protein
MTHRLPSTFELDSYIPPTQGVTTIKITDDTLVEYNGRVYMIQELLHKSYLEGRNNISTHVESRGPLFHSWSEIPDSLPNMIFGVPKAQTPGNMSQKPIDTRVWPGH